MYAGGTAGLGAYVTVAGVSVTVLGMLVDVEGIYASKGARIVLNSAAPLELTQLRLGNDSTCTVVCLFSFYALY